MKILKTSCVAPSTQPERKSFFLDNKITAIAIKGIETGANWITMGIKSIVAKITEMFPSIDRFKSIFEKNLFSYPPRLKPVDDHCDSGMGAPKA